MSTIKTMSLDEVANYEIPAEDLERLNGFNNTDFSDCPKDTLVTGNLALLQFF